MNLLLLEDGDFIADDRVLLSGRRLKHLHEVHRAEAGDSLRVGRLNGLMGSGQLLRLDAEHAEIWLDGSSLVAGVKMLLGIDPKQDYKDKVAVVDLR